MSDGFDRPTAYGHIDGIDDPSMGWARYAQVRRGPEPVTGECPLLDNVL